MDIYEVVTKLIGQIDPVGETTADNKRFENLKQMTELIDKLLCDINCVAENKDRAEFSVHRAGNYADGFLTDTKSIVVDYIA